jgi:DNA-binding transcriptional regulator YhcF (GntR family)
LAIEFDENIPIYMQIMNLIKRDIVTQKLNKGDKLPSVREMSEILKVNPNTIQRAYQELEREKVTFTQRGMGTFVTEDEGKILTLKKEMSVDVIDSCVKNMRNLGFSNEEIIKGIEEYLKGEVE